MDNNQKNISKKTKTKKKTKSGETKKKNKINRKLNVKKNQDRCSPSHRLNLKSKKNKSKNNSCFTKESLIKIAKAWNQSHQDNKIKLNNNLSSDQLWNQIAHRLKERCNNEWCWIEQEFVKNIGDQEITNETFRPKMPKSWKLNKNEWLTTTDIESVLKQYEDRYPNFKFIGPVPIDFDKKYGFSECIVNELCQINVKDLLDKNIQKVGIVFNLDEHDKPGSHWVAMFADFEKKKINYFDSYGVSPPREVLILMKRLRDQSKELGMNVKLFQSKFRHQYKNSECGVYSIHFIIQLLEGKTLHQFNRNRITDESINKKRNYYFRNEHN